MYNATGNERGTASRQRPVRRVPVTEQDGRIVGAIAQADVALKADRRGHEVGEAMRKIPEPGGPVRS